MSKLFQFRGIIYLSHFHWQRVKQPITITIILYACQSHHHDIRVLLPFWPRGRCGNWLLHHSLPLTAWACSQGRDALIWTKAWTSQLILHADTTGLTDAADWGNLIHVHWATVNMIWLFNKIEWIVEVIQDLTAWEYNYINWTGNSEKVVMNNSGLCQSDSSENINKNIMNFIYRICKIDYEFIYGMQWQGKFQDWTKLNNTSNLVIFDWFCTIHGSSQWPYLELNGLGRQRKTTKNFSEDSLYPGQDLYLLNTNQMHHYLIKSWHIQVEIRLVNVDNWRLQSEDIRLYLNKSVSMNKLCLRNFYVLYECNT